VHDHDDARVQSIGRRVDVSDHERGHHDLSRAVDDALDPGDSAAAVDNPVK
jgi:hypothetical protein